MKFLFMPRNIIKFNQQVVIVFPWSKPGSIKLPLAVFNLVTMLDTERTATGHTTYLIENLNFKQKLKFFLESNKFHRKISPGIYLGLNFFKNYLGDFVDYFLEKGIIESVDQILALSSAEKRKKNKLGSVCFVTSNRPKTFERCLESYLKNTSSHNLKYIIFNDSIDTKVIENYYSMIKRLPPVYKKKILYCGQKERKNFIDKMCEIGIDKEILEFCLFGDKRLSGKNAIGANRNAFLLQTTGQITFCADDDTVCKVMGRTKNPASILCKSEKQHVAFDNFTSAQSAEADLTNFDKSIVDIMENVLGLTTKAAIYQNNKNHSLKALPGLKSELLLNDKKSKVLMALFGLYGDSASNNSYGINLAQKTHNSYDPTIFDTRFITKDYGGSVFSHSSLIMTTFFGLDNRELLPPFLPIDRQEDTLFGETMAQIWPYSAKCNLAYMLKHDPNLPRKNSVHGERQERQIKISLSEFITILMEQITIPQSLTSAKERIIHLGLEIKYMLENEAKKVDQIVYAEILRKKMAIIDFTKIRYKSLKSTLSTEHCHSLKESINILESELELPLGYINNFGIDDSELKHYVFSRAIDYSKLLISWPKIVEKTQFLKVRGVQLAKPFKALDQKKQLFL